MSKSYIRKKAPYFYDAFLLLRNYFIIVTI